MRLPAYNRSSINTATRIISIARRGPREGRPSTRRRRRMMESRAVDCIVNGPVRSRIDSACIVGQYSILCRINKRVRIDVDRLFALIEYYSNDLIKCIAFGTKKIFHVWGIIAIFIRSVLIERLASFWIVIINSRDMEPVFHNFL